MPISIVDSSVLRRVALRAGAAVVLGGASAALAQPSVSVSIPGRANPWLAGMPAGSAAAGGDVAPFESPVLVPIALVGGESIVVADVSGFTGFSPGVSYPPDGGAYGSGFCHGSGAENGIASACWEKVSCLIGVFLDGSVPTSSPAPAATSFLTPASQNYVEIAPLLKQVFFIGDGLRTNGDPQRIIAPAGARRLFLGTSDGTGWFNNVGVFQATVRAGTCGSTDFDGDGDEGTDADIEAFFAVLAGGACPTGTCGSADFDGDGDEGTDADIEALFRVLAGGRC